MNSLQNHPFAVLSRLIQVRRLACTMLIVCIAFGAQLLVIRSAWAATIPVNSTADESGTNAGNCTLREAITAANTDAAFGGCTGGSGADTIALPSGIYTLTIVGAGEDVNLTGDLDITTTLTIVGVDASSTVINANGIDRVLHAVGSAGLTLQNLRVENGKASSSGAGVRADSSLTLSGTHIFSNALTGSNYGGGAIGYGTVVVTNSVFSHNSSQDRANGLYAFNGARLFNTNFLSNTSTGVHGGGAFLNGNVTISGGLFLNNLANWTGALVVNGTLEMTGTQFISNTNNVSGVGGGGLQLNGSGRIVNALFARNQGNSTYGPIYIQAGNVQIIHTTIASPTVGSGAGIYIEGGVTTITNTIIASHAKGIERIGGTVSENYNLFYSNTTHLSGTITSGGNSLIGNPQFQAPFCNGYKLGTASAAIDTGTNAGLISDFEGDLRPLLSGFDIGFDEAISTTIEVPVYCLTVANNSPTVLGNATSLTTSIAGGTNVTYQWNFGDGNTASGMTPTHTYTTAGSFTAVVTASNVLGSVSATTTVTVTNAAPVANAGADQSVTVNASASLSGIASIDPDNHIPLGYTWQQTGGPAVTLNNADAMNANFTAPPAPTVLTFTLGVTDSQGLADPTPDTVVVTVTDVPISGLTAQNSSPTTLGNVTSFTASISAGSNVVYTWNFGDGSPTGGGANATHIYLAAGSYTALVTATNGVSSTSASTAVSIGCAPGLIVLNTNDNSCGSLRQIVISAPANATVTFTPTLAGQTILLTTGQIVINKNLTIDGVDAPGLRVGSNYASRIFYTDSGTNLNLMDLTLINGRNSGDGGAIIAFGALSLTNTSVLSSFVDNGNGGAIYGVGPLYVDGGVFQNNQADLGSGGALVFNAAVLTNTQVISNRANINGGGLLALAAFSIQNSLVQSNTAGGSGGGINAATTMIFTNTTVSGNRANGVGGGGGLRANGAAIFKGGLVQNNTSPNGMGGGLRLASFAMTDTQVLGNSAVDGGGLSHANTGRIANVLLARNSASGNGEAVYANASGQILNTTIASPTINTGAAIYVNVGTVGVTNTLVTSHSIGLQNNVGTLSEGYNLYFGNGANLAGTVTNNGGSVLPPCSDPRFVNPSADNYRLSNGSAAINVGTNVGVSADFEGDVRPTSSSADIGYDETSAADVGVCNLAAANSSPTRLDDTTSFTATITSGSNVTYTWNFGDGSPITAHPTVSGPTASYVYTAVGNYTAIVTAANSAGSLSVAMPVTITNLAPASAAGPDQTATVSSSVTLSSTSSDPDGHTPLSYLWQQTGGPIVVVSNANGPLASFSAPPTPAVLTFTLRVTDSKGLADATPDETIITVIDMPISGLSAINDSPTQLGSTTSLTASVSAGTNVGYVWNFGDGAPIMAGASVTHTYAAVGTYTAMVTATNSVGVTNTTTLVTMVDVPISGLSAANSSPTRLTDATSFTASVSAGTNVLYTWSFGDGGLTVAGATVTHVYTAAGNFSAVVTATNGAGAVSVTTAVTITNLAPLANTGADQTVSILGNVNLIGVSSSDPDNHLPLSYLWQQTGGLGVMLSNPATASPTFTAPSTVGVLTFTLRVTDSQGLGSVLADEVVISVIDIGISGLSANNSSPTRLTDPTYFTASVTVGTGVTYTWGFGDGSPMVMGEFVTHVYTAAGNYAVVLTATNTNGSVNASTVATIVNLAPVADAGSDGQGYAGMQVMLNGSASADPDGHTPLSYEWQQTGGPTVTLSSATAILPSFTAPGAPTVLTFTLTVTDAQGAADATPDEVVLTVLDVPIAGLIAQSSSPTTLGFTTTLTASVSAGTNVTYAWDLGDGSPITARPAITGATVSHVYLTAGLFTATVSASNASGGAFANTVVTVVNLPPAANAGADGSGLIGSSISLDGSASSDPDGHIPLSYAWQQTGGTLVSLSDATATVSAFTAPSAAEVLTFTLIVTDARGLADPTPDEVVVSVLDVPIAGLIAQSSSPTTLGQVTFLSASVTSGTGVVYVWDFGDGSLNVTGASVNHVYVNAGSFVATVTASNTSGQATTTTTVNVVNQAPVANAGADQTVSVSGTVQLSGGNSGDGDGHTPLSYRWTQTGGPNVVLSNPADVSPSFVTPGGPAVLTFTLTVTDARGLADATPDEVVIRALDIGIGGLTATNDGPTTLGKTTTFTATATAGSNVVYTWDFGDGFERQLAPARGDVTVTHTYAAPGTYPVVVTASNGRGAVTAQTLVTVNKKTGMTVYLPVITK